MGCSNQRGHSGVGGQSSVLGRMMPAVSEPVPSSLPFSGDPQADALLARDPMALLIGYVLDQQVPIQKAFSGPLELLRRVGTLDARALALMDPDILERAFRQRPALHRFPGNMARRTQELCAAIASRYAGDPAAIWRDVRSGRELKERLLALPGIGEMKAGSLVGILGRRFGVRPPGWQEVLPPYRTLADVDSPEALAAYQAAKRAQRAEERAREAGGGP